jgi:hypothetical protein
MVGKKNVVQDCFKFCYVTSDFGSHLASVCCRLGSIMVITKCNPLINHIMLRIASHGDNCPASMEAAGINS